MSKTKWYKKAEKSRIGKALTQFAAAVPGVDTATWGLCQECRRAPAVTFRKTASGNDVAICLKCDYEN
jgi:hypothetical protein